MDREVGKPLLVGFFLGFFFGFFSANLLRDIYLNKREHVLLVQTCYKVTTRTKTNGSLFD